MQGFNAVAFFQNSKNYADEISLYSVDYLMRFLELVDYAHKISLNMWITLKFKKRTLGSSFFKGND